MNKTKTKSCIIVCGPKKSGTYLLHSIIRELNYWQDINIAYFNKTWNSGIKLDKVKYGYPNSIIKKIRNGQFAAGHIKYDNRIEKLIENNTSYRNIKMIFIYRDPRDAIISFLNSRNKSLVGINQKKSKFTKNNYVAAFKNWLRNDNFGKTTIEPKKVVRSVDVICSECNYVFKQKYGVKNSSKCPKCNEHGVIDASSFFSAVIYSKFTKNNYVDLSDTEKLSSVINFWQKKVIEKKSYSKFSPWIDNPNCHSIKFEKLYPEIVDLKKGLIGVELKKIFNYIDIDSDKIDSKLFYDKIYNKSFNSSKEINKVGQYKEKFEDVHYKLIDNINFRQELDILGYDW